MKTENIPPVPDSINQRLMQYQSIRSASMMDWAPDGEGILIGTRFSETTQIHRVDNPGSTRYQLTFFDDAATHGRTCPDPRYKGFIFSKDSGGNEKTQLYWFSYNDGSVRMLTDGKSRNEGPLWSKSGERFAFASTKRNGKDWDIYAANTNNMDSSWLLIDKGGMWAPMDWSTDGNTLLVLHQISVNESYLYTYSLKTKELTQVKPSSQKAAYGAALFDHNSNGIFFTSDYNSEFMQLRYVSLKTNKEDVLTASAPWDIEEIALDHDRGRLAYTINIDGIRELKMIETRTFKPIPLQGIPQGQIYDLTFHPDSALLAFSFSSATVPGDVFVYNANTGRTIRWTQSETGGIPPSSFVTPKLIRYPTFDSSDGHRRMIPAFVYRPVNQKKKTPVLISIHGGPEIQYSPSFGPLFQYFVNEMKIAVIMPNVRGSAGYGKSYLKLDNGFLREGAVRDIGSLLDWIALQPDLDSSRVAVMGKSYGGFMSMASMAAYNNRLRCGISTAGITNFITFLTNTGDFRRDARRVEYGDERVPEMRAFLNRISPLTNASSITRPMLIAQGQNDSRVPASEARQIVDAIRKNKGIVYYMLAEDEGHGFSKRSNADYFSAVSVMFLNEFLITARKDSEVRMGIKKSQQYGSSSSGIQEPE